MTQVLGDFRIKHLSNLSFLEALLYPSTLPYNVTDLPKNLFKSVSFKLSILQ